jgi:hypothetical protein
MLTHKAVVEKPLVEKGAELRREIIIAGRRYHMLQRRV